MKIQEKICLISESDLLYMLRYSFEKGNAYPKKEIKNIDDAREWDQIVNSSIYEIIRLYEDNMSYHLLSLSLTKGK